MSAWWEEMKIYGEIESVARTFIVWNIVNNTKSYSTNIKFKIIAV